MNRTIVYILGTSFSGSSLLNSLLDAQPLTRGMGEAIHFVRKPTNAWCGACHCHVDSCALQAKIGVARIYESIFDAYPNANVLVNSSKQWRFCFDDMPLPAPGTRVRLVVLSKSLEEFAYSFASHNDCSFTHGFEVWVRFYKKLLGNIDRVLGGSVNASQAQPLSGRVNRNDIAYVAYRDLATETTATVRQLCDQLGLCFAENYHDTLWRSDTCTIGGNNAIYAQRTANAAFFQSGSRYLSGKYAGRQGIVFYDGQWMHDEALLEAAGQFRRLRDAEVSHLDQRLGHFSQLV